MGYLLLTAFCVIIALLLSLWALKLLLKGNWLLGWLRGTFGIILLMSVFVVGCVAYDIYSYRQLDSEHIVATISFKSLGPQRFEASFVDSAGEPSLFELNGDQWQLDSRIIKWHGFLSRMGLKTGYRLDRISGRYLSLEDERTKERSVHDLSESLAGVDVWLWLKEFNTESMIDARYGNSTFLPMVEGGQYEVAVTASGLLARPLNQPARDAVDQWR